MQMFIVLGLFAVAYGNVIHENKCPDLKPVENFNLTAYQGTWYEISKYPHVNEGNGKCGSAEYKLEGDVMKVKNTHVVNGVQQFVEGTAKLAPDANKAGKLVVSLKVGDAVRESPLMVLVTDYAHYAIAYNCKYDEKTKNHQDFAWILSRSKTLEGEAKTAVDNYIKAHSNEFDSTKLLVTDFSEEACKFTSSSPIKEPVKHH